MNYELLYIVHPDLESTLDKITSKVKNFISGAEGKVEKEEIWGKRKLAYILKKNDFGIYILLNFTLTPLKINKILKELRLQEEILRFMIITTKEKVAPKEELKAVKSEVAVEAEKTEKKEETKEELKEPEKETKKEPKEKRIIKSKKPEKVKELETKPKTKTSEKERLKEIDKKLKEILGDE